MTRFKVTKPVEEVRLRKWPAGRVSQLKIFAGHLQSAVNSSLAAQVAQTPRRKFSEFVPIIPDQNINTEIEFREVRFQFTPPLGLRNLLFYEFQISLTEEFFSFDQFESPEPVYVFSNLIDDQTYFIRARVVTKQGFVGPFSNPVSITTPFSQGFSIIDGTEFNGIIASGTQNTDFRSVLERPYTAIGGSAYYSIDYELEVVITNQDDTKNIEWSDIEFRWLLDDDQVGQNFLVTVYGSNIVAAAAGNTDDSDMEVITADVGSFVGPDSLFLPGPFSLQKRGTFTQKFQTLSSGSQTIKLQARVIDPHPTPNDYIFNTTSLPLPISDVLYGVPARLTLKNFKIFEALIT